MGESDRQLAAEIREQLRDTMFPSNTPIAVEPFLIDRDAHTAMGVSGDAILQLAMRLLRTLGSSASEMAAALNVDVAQYPSMRACASSTLQNWAATHARPDMILPESGVPQLLELNASGAAGGFIEMELFAQFWRAKGWQQVPPMECGTFASRRRLLESARQATGIGKRLVWLASRRDVGDPRTDRFHRVERVELERDGWEVEHYDPADADPGISEHLMSAPKLLFRAYTDAEWAEYGFDVEAILGRLFRTGDMMLPDPISDLLDNKQLLAMLSCGQPWMSEPDRRMVERHLPWTRALGRCDHPLRARCPEAFIDDTAAIRLRESLVVKPAMDMKGNGVLIGRNTRPESWADAVRSVAQAEAGGIVQQLVVPARSSLRMWSEAGSTELTVLPTLSPLLAGGQICGVMVRFDYTNSSSVTVLNTTRQAAAALGIPAER